MQMRGGLNEQCHQELCMVGSEQNMALEGHVERNVAERGDRGPGNGGLIARLRSVAFVQERGKRAWVMAVPERVRGIRV